MKGRYIEDAIEELQGVHHCQYVDIITCRSLETKIIGEVKWVLRAQPTSHPRLQLTNITLARARRRLCHRDRARHSEEITIKV